MSMDPYAVIRTTERLGSRWRISSNSSSPLRSGRLTSSRTRSKGFSSSIARPASPVSALAVEYPSMFSRSSRPSRISDSSSTTRMAPLDMYRFPSHREFQPEGRALSGRGAHIHFPGVLLDDAVAHGESQAGAAPGRFRGEKGIEDAVQILARDARAAVDDLDFDGAVESLGADLDHSTGGHGVARVQKEIQENLLQLVVGAQHRRQLSLQVPRDLHLRGAERMRHQRQHLFHHGVQIDFRKFRRSGTRKIQQVVDDLAGAEGLLHHFLDQLLARIAARKLLGQH